MTYDAETKTHTITMVIGETDAAYYRSVVGEYHPTSALVNRVASLCPKPRRSEPHPLEVGDVVQAKNGPHMALVVFNTWLDTNDRARFGGVKMDGTTYPSLYASGWSKVTP